MADTDNRYLSGEATRCYRLLTELSLALGVIGWELFEERMRFLDDLLGDPNSRLQHQGMQGDSGDSTEDPPPDDSEEPRDDPAHPDVDGSGGSEPPDWLWFIPSGSIGHLKRWHFIKADPDPHPSVPHGHDRGKSFPKLDPYLGWVHISPEKRQGRLKNDDTRALWNDAQFRDFASATLLHFVQENP